MICPKCNTENEDIAKFCAHCGAPLEHVEEPLIKKDITTKLKEEKPRYKDRTLPIVLGLLCVAAILAFLLYLSRGGKAATVCESTSSDAFKVKYTAYEKSGKVNKVYLEMDEIDKENVLDKEGITTLEGLLEQETNSSNSVDGVTMNYKVTEGAELKIHIDVMLELDKIGDDYLGSIFAPYDPSWKNMTIEEFKKSMESFGDISCK